MNDVVLKISKNEEFQKRLINNNNSEVLHSLYHLLMHEHCSVEHFLKYLFQRGFEKNGIFVFRENSIEMSLILDYITRCGGNFQPLITNFIEFACSSNAKRLEFMTSSILKISTEDNTKNISGENSPKRTTGLLRIFSRSDEHVKSITVSTDSTKSSNSGTGTTKPSRTCIDTGSPKSSSKEIKRSKKNIDMVPQQQEEEHTPVTNNPINIQKELLKKTIDLIESLIHDCFSSILLDFCSYICTFLNGFYKNSSTTEVGEQQLCSFIFFNILSPKIITQSKYIQLSHVVSLTSLLNKVAIGSIPEFNDEHMRIRSIVAKMLVKKINVRYTHWYVLNSDDYETNKNILLEEIRKNNLDFKTAIIIEDIPDIKTFLLWKSEDICKLLRNRNVSCDFLSGKNIDGRHFIDLEEKNLLEMGVEEEDDMDMILGIISYALRYSICCLEKMDSNIMLWSCDEMCIWLILVGLDYLIPIFKKKKINGPKLYKMDVFMMQKYGIVKLEAITKLLYLRKVM